MSVRSSIIAAFAILFLGWTAAHAEQYTVPLFPVSGTSGDPQGVLRIVNDTGEATTVQVFAIADDGTRAGPATVALGASAAAEFDATELRSANAAKGLSGGLGDLSGDVRLTIDSDAPIVPLAFVRASDGTLSAMHDTVRGAEAGDDSGGYTYEVPVFNLSTEMIQVSRLRLINAGVADSPAQERLPIVRHDAELRSCPALECRVVAKVPILSYVYVHDKVAARGGQVDRAH